MNILIFFLAILIFFFAFLALYFLLEKNIKYSLILGSKDKHNNENISGKIEPSRKIIHDTPIIGTHKPLLLKVEKGEENIEEVIKDCLDLTLLNFGSFTLGKLSATINHADSLAYLSLNGLISEGDGDIML